MDVDVEDMLEDLLLDMAGDLRFCCFFLNVDHEVQNRKQLSKIQVHLVNFPDKNFLEKNVVKIDFPDHQKMQKFDGFFVVHRLEPPQSLLNRLVELTFLVPEFLEQKLGVDIGVIPERLNGELDSGGLGEVSRDLFGFV